MKQCVVCGGPSESGVCKYHHVQYRYASVIGERNGVLERLIDDVKFRYRKAAAPLLVSMLVVTLEEIAILYDHTKIVIVPVPTIRRHIRQRGYDHALLLARAAAKESGFPIEHMIGRVGRDVQHTLTKKERSVAAPRNYILRKQPHADTTYVIIDDIITTGSTVNAIAGLLKDAGANHVAVVAIARQPLD